MRVLRGLGRVLGRLLTTIAKTIGGLGAGPSGGARTFDHDNATSLSKRPDDYRP